MSKFENKSVIITGAGKGIGKACAIDLARRGAHIIAISRTKSDLEELENTIGSSSVQGDLSDSNVARQAMAEAGPADYLINCAGTNVLESVLDMSDEGYDTVMDINLRAALICCQEFSKMRIAVGGNGSILNVTSIAGHRGFLDHMVYAASKAGLEAATRVMAHELGPHGIRVNAVAPTVTMTELAAAAWSNPEKKDPMLARHPLGRFAEVEDVAKAISMMLCDESAIITGSVIPIDCGFLAV